MKVEVWSGIWGECRIFGRKSRFIRIFVPERCKLLPLYIFIFAALVEVLQMFHVVEALGWQDNNSARERGDEKDDESGIIRKYSDGTQREESFVLIKETG